jgi:hypothetical protein
VSEHNAWTEWVLFFLEVLKRQAELNIAVTDKIATLYDDMSAQFRDILRSPWSQVAVDYVFTKPVFRNSAFTAQSGIPAQSAHRIAKKLVDAGILSQLVSASGRRAALLAFQPLLQIVRV